MKTIFVLAISFFIAMAGYSQESQIDSLKLESIQLLEEGNLLKAKSGFEKVLELDSLAVDVLFNLGAINSMLDYHDKAIFYFQKCVKLRDREAAKILKETYNTPIEYHDIMHLEDVDQMPKFKFEGNEYSFLEGTNLNSKFLKSIQNAFKESRVIKKSRFSGTVFLEIEVDKNGKIWCNIMRSTNDIKLDLEIVSIIENLTEIIPAKYQGKDVGIYSFRLPIRL